jgi:hypothetical protein
MQIRGMAVRFALESNKQLDYTTDNSKSKLPRKAAFGSDLVHGGKYENLPMWVLKSKAGRHSVQNNAEYTEVHVNLIQNMAFTQISQWEQLSVNLVSVIPAEVNFTLSSFMTDELVNSYQSAIMGTKNDPNNEYRKMMEFHLYLAVPTARLYLRAIHDCIATRWSWSSRVRLNK